MAPLIPILGAVALGGVIWVVSRPKRTRSRKKKKQQVTPGPTPSGPPRDPDIAPEPDDQSIPGLEIERIEGIYSFARIYERGDGQFRVNVIFTPPPSQVNSAMTVEINEIVPSFNEAMELAGDLLFAYGRPHFTPNDLIVKIHESGDTRYSVWKHATEGSFYVVMVTPDSLGAMTHPGTPEEALQEALAMRQCQRSGGIWTPGVGCN